MNALKNPSFIIFGPRTLQNSVLSTYIRNICALPCQILSSLTDIQTIPLDNGVLFLVDVSASTSYLDLLDPLGNMVKVALINADDTEEGVYDILRRFDLRGIFLKNSTSEQFAQGINAILANECWFSRKLTAKMFYQIRQEQYKKPAFAGLDADLSDILTCKEIQILQAMAGGHTNQGIADQLFLSPHTVKTHLYHLYQKLGVTNRVQAVNWAKQYLRNELEN